MGETGQKRTVVGCADMREGRRGSGKDDTGGDGELLEHGMIPLE